MLELLIARALVAQLLTELLERAGTEPLRQLVTPDFRLHLGASSAAARGLDALRPLLAGTRTALARRSLEILDLVAEGDRVAARFLLEGDPAAAGAAARVRLPGMLLARLRAGRVSEVWLEQDLLAEVARPAGGSSDLVRPTQVSPALLSY